MKKKLRQKPKPNQKLKPSFWDNGGRPIMIAHRGGNAAGGDKENTLEAFQAAQDLGYSYAETDVIVAASGEVVVIHGSLNWLQAGINRDITRRILQKMTLSQIRQTLKPGGAQIPTLQEVLETFPKMKFILDLKTDEVALPLAELIEKTKTHQRVCVTGFSYGRTRAFIKACGQHQTNSGLTVGRGLRFKNMNLLMLKAGRLSDVEAVFMHHSLISTPMVNLVHHRGLKAIVWTANSSLGIKHALRSGVDGVISDRVQFLKEVISSN